MGDTDFPTILGNGGNSYGFLQGWKERLQSGSIDNTQLPTTGEYAQYQQTMQDGQFSPLEVDYGQFASTPKGSTGGSTGEFDPAYLEKMKQPGTQMPDWMRRNPPTPGGPQTPGETGAQQAFGEMQFPIPFGSIAGAPSFEIPKGQGALGNRSGEQLLRLQQGSGNMQNQQLQNELERRGILSRGIQLPPV